MFDTILVVTDGTDPESRHTRRAAELAATHDADLHALYVVDVPKDWDVAVERREAAGERAVEAVADRAEALGVPVTKHFRYGRQHAEVVDYADAHDVDLVVVPSTTRRGVSRLLHPTDLAERVLARTDVPVLGIDAEDAGFAPVEEDGSDGRPSTTAD